MGYGKDNVKRSKKDSRWNDDRPMNAYEDEEEQNFTPTTTSHSQAPTDHLDNHDNQLINNHQQKQKNFNDQNNSKKQNRSDANGYGMRNHNNNSTSNNRRNHNNNASRNHNSSSRNQNSNRQQNQNNGNLNLIDGVVKRELEVGPRGDISGIWPFDLNERVLAKFPTPSGYFYPATITSCQGFGFYGVRFDTDRKVEYINIPTKHIQCLNEHINYEIDQKVHVLFMKTRTWKPATIISKISAVKYEIMFDGFSKNFDAFTEIIRPILDVGEDVFAYWYAFDKFVPATIVDVEENTYSIKFKKMDKEFAGQRPDCILPLEVYEEGDEVAALWLKDKKLHPGQVVEIIDPWNVSISFSEKLKKNFIMPIHKIRKI